MTNDINDVNDQAVQIIVKQVVQTMNKLMEQNNAAMDRKISSAKVSGKNILPYTIEANQISGLAAEIERIVAAKLVEHGIHTVGTE